jgi:hypothetical protein
MDGREAFGFSPHRSIKFLFLVAAVVCAAVAAIVGLHGAATAPAPTPDPGYTAYLESPTPPATSDTYTWIVEGSKPSPAREISNVGLSGCWTLTDIDTVTISVGTLQLTPDGTMKVNSLDDTKLPLTITVSFKQAWPSAADQATIRIKAGKTYLLDISVGGPMCRGADVKISGQRCSARRQINASQNTRSRSQNAATTAPPTGDITSTPV